VVNEVCKPRVLRFMHTVGRFVSWLSPVAVPGQGNMVFMVYPIEVLSWTHLEFRGYKAFLFVFKINANASGKKHRRIKIL